MPALPLDEAGKYVAAAYLVFLALILVYVAIMAREAGAHRARASSDELAELPARRGSEAERDERAARARHVAQDRAAGGARAHRADRRRRRAAAARAARASPTIHEAVVLSTCNRTELYLVVGDPVEAETAVVGACSRARPGCGRPSCSRASTRCATATRRATCTASSAGSTRWSSARPRSRARSSAPTSSRSAPRTTGPLTNKLFRAALATGKRVRTETAISEGRSSVASVAVDLARDALGDLARPPRADHRRRRDRRADRAGAARAAACATMFVANRRRERAQALAQRFGGATVSLRRAAGRARARRHRRRLDLLAARPDRGRGAAPRCSSAATGARCC